MSRNQVRIIGGAFRGRHIHFTPVSDLRPTPDRVRETLFNWLMHDIHGARCLDAFAGSGGLGLEALSRGACFVVFIDQHPLVCKNLHAILAELELYHERAHVTNKDVVRWLNQTCLEPFDLIFLDPPYRRKLLGLTLSMIKLHRWLKPGGKVYIEFGDELDAAQLNELGWQVLRLS